MNKKVLIISITLLTLIIGGLIFVKNGSQMNGANIEKQIVNLLNSGKIGSDISEYDKEVYEYAKKDLLNVEWNIDYFIKKHIEYLKDCILVKEGKKSSSEAGNKIMMPSDLLSLKQDGEEITADMMHNLDNHIQGRWLNKSPDKGTYRFEFADFVAKNMTEQDIKDYYDNKFEEKVVKKLENSFTHKSGNHYEGWYIKNNENRNIDLLYGLYAEFLPDYKKNTNELSKAIDIKLGEKMEFDDRTISNSIPSTLTYIDKNGAKKEISENVIFIKNDKKYSICQYLCSELFYKNESYPNFVIHSSDYEKNKTENGYTNTELIENEIAEDNKPWNKVVDETEIYIKLFDKYNSGASITFYEYADGHVSAEYGAVKGKKDNIGYIKRTYINEQLTYDNMTKDNILDLYLADTERVKRNEEDLKKDNCFYSGG